MTLIFIAHDAFGAFDELFLFLVIGIFVVMLMGPIAIAALRKEPPPPENQEVSEESAERPVNHFKLD